MREADKLKKAFDDVAKAVQDGQGWVTSPPGPVLRFEVRSGETAVADALRGSGWQVDGPLYQGERVGAFDRGEVKDVHGKVTQTYPVSAIIKTEVYTVTISQAPQRQPEQHKAERLAVAGNRKGVQ
jgi:hypothetical protein